MEKLLSLFNSCYKRISISVYDKSENLILRSTEHKVSTSITNAKKEVGLPYTDADDFLYVWNKQSTNALCSIPRSSIKNFTINACNNFTEVLLTTEFLKYCIYFYG